MHSSGARRVDEVPGGVARDPPGGDGLSRRMCSLRWFLVNSPGCVENPPQTSLVLPKIEVIFGATRLVYKAKIGPNLWGYVLPIIGYEE